MTKSMMQECPECPMNKECQVEKKIDAVARRIGVRISEIRLELRLTQQILAEDIGISTKYLQRLEAGLQRPSLPTLVAAAFALKVELSDLLSEPQMERKPTVGRPPKQRK